jgi:4a-hydroxytetrahydrobiopterin dehydratase
MTTSCEVGVTPTDGPLAKRKCIPCEGGIPKLEPDEVATFLKQLNGAWTVVDGHHLRRNYTFPDFAGALAFVNRVGALAEENGHHPDLSLTWGKAAIELYTHAVNGLTETDFILAAKVDEL